MMLPGTGLEAIVREVAIASGGDIGGFFGTRDSLADSISVLDGKISDAVARCAQDATVVLRPLRSSQEEDRPPRSCTRHVVRRQGSTLS
jgi:hypothetical protein